MRILRFSIESPCLSVIGIRFGRPPRWQGAIRASVAYRGARTGCGGLLEDLGDDAGADGAAALADGELQALFARDRLISSTSISMLSPGITISTPSGSVDVAGHVGRAEVELRPVALEERRVAPALFLLEHVHLGLEVRVRLDRARLAQHLARARPPRA